MATAVQERLVEVEVEEEALPGGGRPAGEQKTFRAYTPEQVLLMSPVLQEWVPEGDLAHFVSDLVESGTLDLSAIYASYEGECGYPPYDPRLMVKLLVYGYCVGVSSSRKIQKRLVEDIAFRVLAANNTPDFKTIADFRKGNKEAIKKVCKEFMLLCKRLELFGGS